MSERDLERDPKTVPKNVRAEVIGRDHSCCRVCGRYVEFPALHHVAYRSQGGSNTVGNLVVVGWQPGHDCHLSVVHANKRLWQPILFTVIANPGTTAYQIRRWGEVTSAPVESM